MLLTINVDPQQEPNIDQAKYCSMARVNLITLKGNFYEQTA